MNGEATAATAPRPKRPRPALATGYVAPRDALERTLARFWEDVLAVAPVGVDDDFFELGGESLHAFALIARVADEWGVALAPRDLFACPSVGAMAAVVAAKRSQR